jgi:2-dehydropantoate 2-reductase
MSEAKRIAILGAGRIGSTFAFYLSRAGHDVTLIARGPRLQALQRDAAIVSIDGARVGVRVSDALDPSTRYDAVLVTVLTHQIEALLPELERCSAQTVLFLFNTFERTARFRDAIGPSRLALGFPNMSAFFVDGRLRCVVDGPGMGTTLSSAAWAQVLRAAGLPTEVEPDMDSFLRSHVAMAVPLLAAGVLMWKRGTSLSWSEAQRLAEAWREGLRLVRELGHPLKPRFVAVLGALPTCVLTALMWGLSRSAAVKDAGDLGPGEVRTLIDAMAAAAPGRTPKLLAIRP